MNECPWCRSELDYKKIWLMRDKPESMATLCRQCVQRIEVEVVMMPVFLPAVTFEFS